MSEVGKAEWREVDDVWKDYNIHSSRLYHNGEKTPYKGVFKDGRLVFMPFKTYKVLPNEKALEIAERVAEEVDAKRFLTWTADWVIDYEKSAGIEYRDEKHILRTGKFGDQIHALYKMGEPVVIDKTEVEIGFGIHNAIDGSLGFGVVGFSFRPFCNNMVFMVAGKRAFRLGEMAFGEGLALVYQKHTKNFDVSDFGLQDKVTKVVKETQAIIEAYQTWTEIRLNQEIAEGIAKLLPKRDIVKNLPYIELEKDKVVLNPELVPTLWEAYNDTTEAIWHLSKSRSIIRRKERFAKLHMLMPNMPTPTRKVA